MFRLLPRLCALLLVSGLGLQAQAQPAAPAAVPVGTAFAQRKAIDQALDFVGRVEAVGRVEVRARVVGFLDAVQFKEGEPIKEGAPLYRIEPDLFEAAVVDGAGVIRQGRSIVIPLLRRSLVFVALMTLINSVQVFDPVYLLTQGGPADSTNVISYDIQRAAFQNGLAGEASAMAVSLFLVLVIVTGSLLGAARRGER